MNYHNRVMNIRLKMPEWVRHGEADVQRAYRTAHRDVRHEAAELMNEAENRITELTKQVEELEAERRRLSNKVRE